MDIFLVIILGIVLVILWNRSQDSTARLRDELAHLQREVNFLQSQLAALVKSNAAREAPAAPTPVPSQFAPVSEPATNSETRVETPTPIEASHSVVTPMAAFRATADARVLPAAQPIPPPTPLPPQPIQEPKPWFDEVPTPQQAAAAPVASPPVSPSQPPVSFTPSWASTPAQPAVPGRSFSLEETLGANWLGKIGIAILVIGIASFLALKLQSWGPAGKVLCGFAVSAVLLGGGVWLERKETYRLFARGGIGGGWALAFFTTYAMYHLPAAHVIDSLPADLVWMLIVAAGMVAHSLRYRSQTVTALAFMLGFATLLVSHMGEPSETVVFSLTASAILAIALVVITTVRHWAVLELCGLIAVYLSHLIWLTKVLPENHSEFTEFWPSTVLILLYWLIFRLAYVLRTPIDKKEEDTSSVSAVLNSGGVLGLLKFQSAHPEWAFWALVTLGLFEMALAYWAKPKRRQAFVVLSTIASVLLIASVPFRFHGVSWPVLWLVEAQVLAICGLRLGEPVFRRLGLLTGVVTGVVLALHDVAPLAVTRILAPDPERHWSLTAALAQAALLYWTHAEIYPRRWPEITADPLETFALRLTSWLGLATAATCLWVVVPDQWLPVGWLALSLILVATGHRFHADSPPLEGDILSLVAAGVLIFHHVLPLVFVRFESEDLSHHPGTTAVLAIAAVAFWIRGEMFPRASPKLQASTDWDPAAWEGVILPIASCLGTAAAAAAIWVGLPAPWVAVGWLALVVLLGFVADWRKSLPLALQADGLALCALVSLVFYNMWQWGRWNFDVPPPIAVVLFYLAARRKTAPGEKSSYIASAYTWVASLLFAVYLMEICEHHHAGEQTPILLIAVFALGLYELGRGFRKGHLRHQGYLILAFAFLMTFSHSALIVRVYSDVSGSRILRLATIFLAVSGYWLQERTRNSDRHSRLGRFAGIVAGVLATALIATWGMEELTQEKFVPDHRFLPVHPGWVAPLWAAMATILLALAWRARRRTFLVQAVALAIAVVLRALLIDLSVESQASFWHEPLFHLAVAALILLAGLAFAFRLRGPDFWTGASMQSPDPLAAALRRPEQWFFFAPFGMMVVAVAAKLSSGHITIAWSLLGLATFLLALAVGERSFRLAGLALLLVSVAKILLMDVWALPPAERYIPLIVLGLALFAVSFLYTRFSATIRKYL